MAKIGRGFSLESNVLRSSAKYADSFLLPFVKGHREDQSKLKHKKNWPVFCTRKSVKNGDSELSAGHRIVSRSWRFAAISAHFISSKSA